MLEPRSGVLCQVDNLQLARIARLAGAPKVQGAGVDLLRKLGDPVQAGQALYRVHAAYPADLGFAQAACDALLLSFDDQATQANALSAACGLPLALVSRHRFPDGELRLQLPFAELGPVPRCMVVYRSLHQPNEKLVELMLLALQARAWGVQRLLLVAPYLAYMRQDVSFHPGEIISQRQVGTALAAWFDGVCTVDPHLHRVATLAEAVPTGWTDTLSAAPLLAEHIAAHIQNPLLIGPDSESAQWVSSAAQHIGC